MPAYKVIPSHPLIVEIAVALRKAVTARCAPLGQVRYSPCWRQRHARPTAQVLSARTGYLELAQINRFETGQLAPLCVKKVQRLAFNSPRFSGVERLEQV